LKPEAGEALLRLMANMKTPEAASPPSGAGSAAEKMQEEIAAMVKDTPGLADSLARGEAEKQAGSSARDLPERDQGQATEWDLKGALLKIKESLKDPAVASGLRDAGLKPSDISEAADKFLRHIELFQLTSRANDMLCTFMPLSWEELNDGELQFRRQDGDENESYTCDIHLDLHSLGRLAVSVTCYAGAFYVTFTAERAEAGDLIASEKGGLEEGFEAQGLRLSAVNVNRKGEVSFGGASSHGVNLKV
jgi:flagellar hook-length control protein FliK